MPFNNGEHDEEITAVETPNAILARIVDHMAGVARSIEAAAPHLQSYRGTDRTFLADALAEQCDELKLALNDLANAFRTLGRYG